MAEKRLFAGFCKEMRNGGNRREWGVREKEAFGAG